MDKLPVCYGQGTSPYCPRCGSGEYLHNEDGNRNDFCGQCGCAIDWERMHNEDAGEIEEGEMERLTQKDDQGRWSLKGIRWKDISAGQIITEKIWEKLYGALWKLMQYEDAESDPEKVAELMERDTAKAAEHAPTGYGMICPVCGDLVQIWQKYCGGCEQRLKKWED